MHLSQDTNRDNSAHVAIKQKVLWDILDGELDGSQLQNLDAKQVLGMLGTLLQPLDMVMSDESSDLDHGARSKERLGPNVSLVLLVDNGREPKAFSRKERHDVNNEPRGEVSRPYGLACIKESSRVSLLCHEIQENIQDKPCIAKHQ